MDGLIKKRRLTKLHVKQASLEPKNDFVIVGSFAFKNKNIFKNNKEFN